MAKTAPHFINGEWRGSAAKANENPSDLANPFGDAASANQTDLAEAIDAAKSAFPAWSISSPQLRHDISDRAGTLALERQKELGHILSSEEGKTLAEGIRESARAGQILKFLPVKRCARPASALPLSAPASMRKSPASRWASSG